MEKKKSQAKKNDEIAVKLAGPELIQQSLNTMQAAFQKILEPAQRIDEMFRQMRKQAQANVEPVIAYIRKTEELHARLADLHDADRVFLPPCLSEFSIQEIQKLFPQSHESALEVYGEIFSGMKNAKLLIQRWSLSPLYPPDRIKILGDALEAHVDGKYTLSVLALMAQLTGILEECFGRRHSGFRKRLPKGKTKTGAQGGERSFFGSDLIAQILCDEMFESTENLKRKKSAAKYPNRHSVLHGSDLEYWKTQEASVRCILVLDYLSSEDFREKIGLQKVKRQPG